MRQLSALPSHKPKRKRRWLSKGEVGCALSHQMAYQHIYNSNEKYALILEDDAEFIASPLEILDETVLDSILIQYEFDVLLIGYVKKKQQELKDYFDCVPIKKRAEITLSDSKLQFGTPWAQYASGTVAYIVTKRGAEKLMAANAVPCVTADDYLYFEQFYGVRVLHYRPTFVLESDDFKSTLGNDRIKKKKFGH
ncbi:glycosyltransferase family 25 protein [Neisseria perflava]|uniref:glycosyltransferase family 25 protein n=1 Tax=Neisseria perflava TaxID=33053 RepID=UPI0020A1C4D9